METKQMCSNVTEIPNFVDWLRSEMDIQNLTMTKLGQISGVHRNTIHNYFVGICEPTLFTAQCLVNALGYELAVVPRDNK